MVLTLSLAFVAGFFAANGLPYFVAGSHGEAVNPSPFRDSATVNVVVGWIGMVVGAVSWAFARVSEHPIPGYTAAALGVLAVGLIHARMWRTNPWRKRTTSSAPS